MAVRDKNIEHDNSYNTFAQHAINFALNLGASLAAVIVAGWRAPWAGKIISAHIYCATMTDADDSVRLDVRKNGTTILSATVDPVAADTATVLTISAANDDFAAGDKLQVYATTGVGDAMVGNVTLMVRPRVGRELMTGFTTL